MKKDKKNSEVNRERKEKFWDVNIKDKKQSEKMEDESEETFKLPQNLNSFKNEIQIKQEGVQNVKEDEKQKNNDPQKKKKSSLFSFHSNNIFFFPMIVIYLFQFSI